MRFTEQLWQSVQPVYHSILRHPFNVELAAGTLALEKFKYYLEQDDLYIKAYARSLASLAAKAPRSDIAQDLLTYAKDGILVEQQLHEHYFSKYEITPTQQAQPACFAYNHFLLSTTVIEAFEIGLAALLPCFWIYREVGAHIAKSSVRNNPFQQWIDTYIDREYDAIVDRMIEITEAVAIESSEQYRALMQTTFIQSTRLEFAFWDAAYQMIRWPL